MKAYMFSFDALLGFMVSLMIIYSLLVSITFPYGYYQEFEQAYVVARDVGLLMYHAEWNDEQTYAQHLAMVLPDDDDFCENGEKGLREIIPGQYAFTIEYYNYSDDDWGVVCNVNATFDDKISCDSPRKFKVYAPLLIADTYEEYQQGDMPYCYVSCHGYEGDGKYVTDDNPQQCTYTPCEAITDYDPFPGIYTGVVRIGVCI